MGSSSSRFNCEICLWPFETNSELDIHNYLEHLIIDRVSGCSPSRIVQDVRVIMHD
jgi:hypothetical protein